jgi:LuxR family transcriptional regulator, maltose regulon positive regulatory protein
VSDRIGCPDHPPADSREETPVESALVATKLHVPAPRSGLIGRARLIDRLKRGLPSRLVLVSAPAGFGKTSLLTQWLAAVAGHGHTVAWLALDQSDNSAPTFWPRLVAAVRTAVPGFGAGLLPLLEASGSTTKGVLAALVNELDALSGELYLVLDDYHLIDDQGIHEGVTFLLEHLPAHAHLLITTRADPPLPLALLRARGDLTEIRAADLRFTPEEASTYLNEVMGLDLQPEAVNALETRTEGWIAALQLAALSMQGRDDVGGFIAGFTGNDRYIVDYLVEEVLARQPDEIRSFLLRTSILDQLSGPLCDAVTGCAGGKAMLEGLERANLLVIPLDDRRRWYRYHHLFADVLLAHLEEEQAEQIPDLHRRASEWYGQQGERSEAIRHALAGGDVERTAELVESALPEMRKARHEMQLRAWVEPLPDEVVRRRPVLAVTFAGALMLSGEFAGAEGRLDDAERRIDASPGSVVGDEGELRRLRGDIEVHRAALAQVRGDVPATVAHAQRAMELALEDDHVVRAGAAGFLGIALWTGGDLEAAHRAWSECVARLEQAGYVSDALGATQALGDICIVQGRLQDALGTYQESLELVPEQSRSLARGTADMHVGMSEIFLERLDLAAANEHLQEAQELGEYAGMTQFPYRWRVATARVRAAEGDLDGALVLINEAERHYVSDFFPNVRPIAARRARLWIANSQLREARGWARQAGVSGDDELNYLREFEHITLARLLLARARSERTESLIGDALALLGRLGAAATAGARAGSMIEILVLEALVLQAEGDTAAALDVLERALTDSEPEGYVQVFMEQGHTMASLLREAARRGIAPAYVAELLASDAAPGRPLPKKQGLIEPLSERELDVLRLLGSDLSGPDIARELMVSLNTLRTHTKNIYMKLGVNNRRAALRRAQELDLLSRTHHA